MKNFSLVFALFILFFAVSCDSGLKFNNPNDPANAIKPKQGEIGGECYPNKTCNKGLICDEESNSCIEDSETPTDTENAEPTDTSDTESTTEPTDEPTTEPTNPTDEPTEEQDTDTDTDNPDTTDTSDTADNPDPTPEQPDNGDSGNSQSDDSDSSDSTDDADLSDSHSDDDTDTSDSDNDSGNSTSDEDNDTADSGSNNGEGDNTDTSSEHPCTEGETRLGETVCGSTGHGKLYQKCENGDWEDTEKCTCDPGEYPEVCGYYAQKMWFTSLSKIGPIDAVEGWTRTYFHIVQEQEQDKVHIKATYCNIKIDNDKSTLLKIIMPQSFADALRTANKESYITKNDDGSFGFNQDIFWEIRGIDPACYGDNPAGYTLPANYNDPCVQDWDNDGGLGLTVYAIGSIGGNSTMYMVEKSSSTIHDGLVSADGMKINALVDWTDEQKILVVEGVNQLLKSGAQNLQQNSSKQPGFTGPFNFIEQFKIPEGSDCNYIVTNAATIFPPDPVILK